MSTPHRSLRLLPSFLPRATQTLLLWHSLRLLSLPSQTTSLARKTTRQWLKSNPSFPTGPPTADQLAHGVPGWPEWPFPAEEASQWAGAHFDGVISGYREMQVRRGMWPTDSPELTAALQKLYKLVPLPEGAAGAGSVGVDEGSPDPPPHVLLHLLHLSGEGEIRPHVDNLEASGGTIVSLSLGGERLLRLEKTDQYGGPGEGEPDELEVLLEPGMVNVQT